MNTNKREPIKNKELLELVVQIKKGNEIAFQRFYECTYQHLTFYLSQFTSDIEQQKDLLQETYLSAHKNFYQLKDDMAVMGWLRSIARNKWVDSVRKEHLQFVSYEDAETLQNIEEDNVDALPECKMDKEECARLLKDIIQNLDESQRYLITEFYYNKRKVKDIAKELQISEGTVKSNLSRTRTLIKEKILELEKTHGTRIYSVNIGSLLLLFFQYGEEIYIVPDAIQTFSKKFAKNIIKNTTEKTGKALLKTVQGCNKSSLLGIMKGNVIFMALKGKILVATIAGIAVVGGTTGAIYATTANNNIEQIKNSITIEAGEELNIEAKDFFKAKKDSSLAKVNFDATGINVDEVGEYELKATFGKNEYTVTVQVEDTTAPNVTITERVLYVSDLEKVDYSNMGVTVYDASDFKSSLKLVKKLGTLEDRTDDKIVELVSKINTPCDQEKLAGMKAIKKVKENGIYRGVVEYKDEHDNVWYEEILVVYDNPKLVKEEKVEEVVEDTKTEEKVEEKVETTTQTQQTTTNQEETKTEEEVEEKVETETQKEETPEKQEETKPEEPTTQPEEKPEENKTTQKEDSNKQESKPSNSESSSTAGLSAGQQAAVNAGYYNVVPNPDGGYCVLVRGDEYSKGRQLIEDYLKGMGLEPRDMRGGWIDSRNDLYFVKALSAVELSTFDPNDMSTWD